MTILPNKKNKPGAAKDERGGNERKRSRSVLYPSTGVAPKNSKNKNKQRRETPRLDTVPSSTPRIPDVQFTSLNKTGLTPRQVQFPTGLSTPTSPQPSHILSSPQRSAVEEETGYNSGDEYQKHVPYSEEREKEFRILLKEAKGFQINDVVPDGACLFRSVSDQIYGDQDMHDVVRKRCCDYMELNKDYFQHFVTENFKNYILRKRQPHTHGNHIEIQAMSEQYCRLFEIYEYSHIPRNVDYTESPPIEAPIRLSYHNGNHYNSVRDPYRASIGVGLGIAGLNPGQADESLMTTAVEESLNETERRMLLDKAKMTDYQATDQALLAQVARDSLHEFCQKKKKVPLNQSLNRLKNSPSSSPRAGTSKPTPPVTPPKSPNSSIELSQTLECSSRLNHIILPSSQDSNEPGPSSRVEANNQWALSDWISEKDEDSVLAAVLQQSAQDYFKQ